MRPFRFFFGVSLAVIMFFFLARFVVIALMAAAVLSVIFHVSRKIKNFFLNLSWEEDDHYISDFRRQYQISPRYSKVNEDMYYDYPSKKAEFLADYRSIRIN